MRRIYSTLRPPIDRKSYAGWITKQDHKLSISTRGLVAFTSSFCLNRRHPNSAAYHIYVVDINTPYQPFLVAESEYEFNVVEWDFSGSRLLVCDVRGCATIYCSKDYLISDWKPYFKQVFAAETFLTASWFHPGLANTINMNKNPSNHLEYSDKVHQNKFGASLRLFGGKSAEGCILVSRTGLVCCLSLMTDGSVDVVSESLGPLRSRIEVADICHCKDGSFIVGTSAGSINSTIAFHQIVLTAKNLTLDEVDMFTGGESYRRVNVTCSQFYSFHLNIMSQMLTEKENSTTFERVAHIKFVTKDSPDNVLVEVSGQNLSLIELWELEPKKKQPIHAAIVEGNTGDRIDHPSKEWVFKGNYINEKELVAIQVPRFRIFGPSIFLLTFKDSTICAMRKEDLQPIVNSTLEDLTSAYITDIQFSCNQTTFVAIDTMSQLHIGRLPALVSCQDDETYLQYLLEYCLITGNDWWDVMVCASESSIESICDKFQDAYERQPKHVQRKYFNRQLMIRASLFRCLNSVSSLCKSSDCHTMIMLNSIASTLKSMLRSQDQDSPGEYLSNFLKTQGTQSNFFNCNNVINKINENQFYVETNLIQCLQPLNQWIVDLAVYLVVSLPQRVKFRSQLPGASLASNKEALETLRELLIIIRIWGLQNETSLPNVYKLNDQLDVIGGLFKIISMCYTTLGNEPDETLLEECSQFANSILISQFAFVLAPIGVASPLLQRNHQQQNQLQQQQLQQQRQPRIQPFLQPKAEQQHPRDSYLALEYFREPSMPETAKLGSVEGSINMKGNRVIDVVRNISLGAHPVANVRHCTRCQSVSLIKPSFQTTRAWEQRWISSCVCGGSWAQSDKTFVDKASHLAMLHYTSTVTLLTQAHQLVR